MKRVILIAATLFILLTSVCSAFEQPDPNRWLWITSTDKVGCWVDLQTIKFETQDNEYRECYKHCFVTAWVQMYDAEKETVSLQKVSLDLECEKFAMLSVSIYDKDSKLINSADFPTYMQNYDSIVPGTVGESILICFKDLWQINEYAKNIKNSDEV